MTRPFVLLLLLCLLAHQTTKAQFWMQKGGGLTIDEAYDIAVDSAGNSYTTGYFTGTATFGGSSETAAGGTDIFVVKTNALGAIEWFARAGGSGGDRGLAIAATAGGDCYVTGYFSGTADFGGQSISANGSLDAFIAKYNSSGVLQWVKRAGGSFADQGNDIAVDDAGNAVVTGDFRDTADFGLTTLFSLGNASDIFISKLDASGNFQWTQQGSSVNSDRGLNVSLDNSGNIYATGQFSQNITFDQLHTNGMFNVTYLVKLNSLGVEQWFRIIGGGTSNECTGLAAATTGETYLTGVFSGSLTFYGPGSATISTTYTNKIFVASYDAQGTFRWGLAHGSENSLSSNSIAVDAAGNAAIIGSFDCVLDEYSAIYGSGTFNSVGHSDVYVSAFDSSGTWLLSRNTGGQNNDYGYGIAMTDNGLMHVAGSFRAKLNFPVSGNFISTNLSLWTSGTCLTNNGYCGDPDYGTFYGFNSVGSSDAFFANCFDPGRAPYDYYIREGTGCIRDAILPCIGSQCQDTVLFCQTTMLEANTRQCSFAGQKFRYQWNTTLFDTLQSTTYPINATNVVYLRTNDDCLVMNDSVHYMPFIRPLISDDKGVNTMVEFAQEILLCAPDTVELTGFPNGVFPHEWTGPGISGSVMDSVVLVHESGAYTFTYADSFGCEHYNIVNVTIQDSLPPFILGLNPPDTVEFCTGGFFAMSMFDSISNPAGNPICFNTLPYGVITSQTITPSAFVLVTCQSQFIITPQDSGMHTITAQVVRVNACGSDTHTISRQFFVKLLQSPPEPFFVLTLSGGPYYCPGDSIVLKAGGSSNYNWSGPGFTNVTADSIFAYQDGVYYLDAEEIDTAANGCTSSYDFHLQACVRQKPQPTLNVPNPLICPGDSVLMLANHSQPFNPCVPPLPSGPHFKWFGPSGQLNASGTFAYAHEAGTYYVIFSDSDSCALVSNTVTINQYTTPSLNILGNPVLCEGDSVTISVIADLGSTILWEPPLSGSELEKTIYEPGIYSCKIISCGIETIDTVEILPSQVEANISATKSLCLNDSTTLFGSPGMNSYLWSPGGATSDSLVITTPGIYNLTTTDAYGCVAISEPFSISMDQIATRISLLRDTNICSGDSILISANLTTAAFHWQPGGQTTQSILVTKPGEYWLTTIDTNDCPGTSDSVMVDTITTWATVLVDGETTFCEGGFVTFTAARKAGITSYQWLPSLDSTASITQVNSGSIVLTTIDTAGCKATSNPIAVMVQPDDIQAPDVRDTSICKGTIAILKPMNRIDGNVHWVKNGDTTNVFIGQKLETGLLTKTTVYQLWEDFGLCQSQPATVTVSIVDCESVQIPNVFTPNGDGFNDLFRTNLEAHTCFHCYIYNRWGQLIYEMHDYEIGWDGTLGSTGNPVPEGVYYYLVEYCQYDEEVVNFRGSVTLIRE